MQLSASLARQIIENMPVNIMLCDPASMNVTYANKLSRDTLDKLKDSLPPGVTGSSIVGKCIDIFHKNPQHQRRLLEERSNLPHKAVIRLGKEFLQLQITEVSGFFGSQRQLMLTWAVTTEAERLRRMVDNMPINIMLADPDDFDIVYMNKTSLDTLRTVEHLLPVKADKVLGSNIDVFHKNPGHQRKMLSDPRNLPHKAKIRLGTEWLELNVAAIKDDKGDYIGPMVSWGVITKQVQVADNVQQIASTVAAASTQLHQNLDQMGKFISSATQQSGTASNAAMQTSSNVQSVASAAEEMNASVGEISLNMTKSKAAVDQVVDRATLAGNSAHSLEAAAKSMGSIVELIQSIAGQINLLALNATIESARAGDAGKGFAVVASEVKNLATQTTKATEDIAKEIANMQNVSEQVIQSLGDIMKSVDEVNRYVSGVASALEEQTAVTRDISSNMQTASAGVEHVTQNVSTIANATQQADESAKQMQEAARMLSQQAEKLNLEMKVLIG
jgi:methyl-accepting chemotaxis protein